MTLVERLESVRERIERAALRAGRDAADVQLVAVSKTMSPERVREMVSAGHALFGENRLQDAMTKIPVVEGARWHFIGTLQRNKARAVVEHFAMIHSVDGVKLARSLARLGEERDAPVRALVQVNVGREATKGGVEVDELPEMLDEIAPLRGLAVEGLMAIPPFLDDPEEVRPYFRALAELARVEGARGRPGISMRQLSMGMSGDFEVAIEEGATFVRVGTALFGPRG